MFSTTGEIDCLNSALYSVRGAEELISMITARRTVHKLVLGHNKLGDDGCVTLFTFLGSTAGRKYPVTYISLNANDIGERGLFAIAKYLKDNQYLKQLFLHNNKLVGSTLTIATFVDAVNSSQLEGLSLSMNNQLSDPFVEIFLPALESPHLRELYISGLDITPRSCPHIVAYLSSPNRCRLRSFNCNCNSLGFRGVRSIIDAIKRHNHTIPTVELHANQQPDDDEDTHGWSQYSSWKAYEALLSRVLTRNKLLKLETERQALRLLRYARPLLLHSALLSPAVSSLSTPAPYIPGSPPFLTLPSEIKQYILSFLGPTLSIAQRIRIFNYASTPSTLPPLLPCLFPDSAKGADGQFVAGTYLPTHSTGIWQKEQASARWLRDIGCDGYALEEDEDPDGERVTRTIHMAHAPWRA